MSHWLRTHKYDYVIEILPCICFCKGGKVLSTLVTSIIQRMKKERRSSLGLYEFLKVCRTFFLSPFNLIMEIMLKWDTFFLEWDIFEWEISLFRMGDTSLIKKTNTFALKITWYLITPKIIKTCQIYTLFVSHSTVLNLSQTPVVVLFPSWHLVIDLTIMIIVPPPTGHPRPAWNSRRWRTPWSTRFPWWERSSWCSGKTPFQRSGYYLIHNWCVKDFWKSFKWVWSCLICHDMLLLIFFIYHTHRSLSCDRWNKHRVSWVVLHVLPPRCLKM